MSEWRYLASVGFMNNTIGGAAALINNQTIHKCITCPQDSIGNQTVKHVILNQYNQIKAGIY